MGKATAVEIDQISVVICHLADGSFHAVENRCTHDDEPLGHAEIDGCDIICPRHLARFDVRDGSVTALPAFYPIETYPVEIRHGELFVEIDG